ncbi:unnamed protein product [Parascedosporium putredinis]|uniref:Zn(2)-C6 fungal-type domain-containing protein n=1 Tax=Parascedosporium putredinis TaxID=1442378 RepID=A0A9P1M7D8_9PEZI|nr:unnamed protein product [Parascedosporium putredinis]CAI7987598.1 unnamed protein product [Parascedosporium putredinis]
MEAPETMSEASSTHDSRRPSSAGEGDENDDQNRKKATTRKRTKTGCITCRKRRIKCDEGRPTCALYAKCHAPHTLGALVSSQPPHGGGFRWDNGRPQNAAEPLTPGSLPFAPSTRGSGQTVIDAHDGILRQPYDPDILVEDGMVDHEMADSDGEVDERAAGFEMENMDPGESMRKRSTFGALIDGRLVPHNEIHETRMRTFSAYARGTTLATYVPASGHVLPTDPQTMAVFRLPEQLVPQVNQNIWTLHIAKMLNKPFAADTFPMLSLNHPALLQAMLALGALQIANLQRNPHSCNEALSPCSPEDCQVRAQLYAQSPPRDVGGHSATGVFRSMVIRPHEMRKRRQQFEEENIQDPFNPWLDYSSVDTTAPGLDEIDVGLLSTITGRRLSEDDYGYGVDLDTLPRMSLPTDRDIEYYEHLRDLFWWNCKMDVYQSILGATRLFMRLDEWLPCPPRAPVGRLDAIYGTFDYLLLLMGRLSEFVSDDLPRKRMANKVPGPPGAPSPPMFPGMFPSRGKVSAPSGFSSSRDASPQSDGFEDGDIHAATEAALAKWESLRQAFEVFRARLGPEFQPLADEYSDRRDSPFGPAIQYRTFSVAGIWMNFNMGLICLYRAHPSMPPAAMMAAGRAARDTAPMAREIGRIAAGLSDDTLTITEISTLYQDSVQRHWLIQRLHDISRLTGWGSARQIAEGCEASWVRAAHMGRGPPYVRSADLMAGGPLTVWSNPRRIDKRIQELEEGGEVVLAKADRAHLALGLLGVDGDLDRLKLSDD